MPVSKKHYAELCQLFAAIKNEAEADKFIQDMLTPQEVDSLCERWQLIQQLHAGVPQREIAEKLGISISKITRGSRMLQYGKGGFLTMLKRLAK
jgi:TrpR family transcriptional regulator, trp operon repressor